MGGGIRIGQHYEECRGINVISLNLYLFCTIYNTYKIFACFQDLPESLAKLKKLERLDLGDNEIDHLPPHIGELCSLEGKN